MKNWKLVKYNEATGEVADVTRFEALDLDAARQHVISQFPQFYYGCNVIEVDAQGETVEGGDFLCEAVKEYYLANDLEGPVPITEEERQ